MTACYVANPSSTVIDDGVSAADSVDDNPQVSCDPASGSMPADSPMVRRVSHNGLMAELEQLIGGVDFGEGPRWHDGALWYCDFFQRAIYTVTMDGTRTAVHADLEDQTSGLGWLPDGRLLVVSMKRQLVLRDEGGTLVEHADLSGIAGGLCNDMVVDAEGNAYVGNFGFDYYGNAEFRAADLALVRPDGSVEVAARGLRFPNGSVITPDGATLIVGESAGAGYQAFDIAADATLGPARQWAHLEGAAPDGCTLDADGGIWFSDAAGVAGRPCRGGRRGDSPRGDADADVCVRPGR